MSGKSKCGGVGATRPGLPPTERTRWFTGRFLTAADLTAEQAYHQGRLRLHNRLFHGAGIVCGLTVQPNPAPECAGEWVEVTSGIAVDCYGREIIVDELQHLRWAPDPDCPGVEVAVLHVRYDECPIDPQPVIVVDCDESGGNEPGRWREGGWFAVQPVDLEGDDCWSRLVKGAGIPEPCRHDCDDDPTGGGCIEPFCGGDEGGCGCGCGDVVPLAVLVRLPGGPILIDVLVEPEIEVEVEVEVEVKIEVDEDGIEIRPEAIEVEVEEEVRYRRVDVRTMLPPPQKYLTHIVRTSWEHAGRVSYRELVRKRGEIVIHFDRPVRDGARGIGISEHTFVVEAESSNLERERLECDPDHPPHIRGDGCEAVFRIDPHRLRRGLVGMTILVTIYGDLVHDCHGLSVDADFLGRFPSGDGVQGGTFRSWFHVTEDE